MSPRDASASKKTEQGNLLARCLLPVLEKNPDPSTSGNQLGTRWTWRPAWTCCFSRWKLAWKYMQDEKYIQEKKVYAGQKGSPRFQFFSRRPNPAWVPPALAVPGHPLDHVIRRLHCALCIFLQSKSCYKRSPCSTTRRTRARSRGLGGGWSSSW